MQTFDVLSPLPTRPCPLAHDPLGRDKAENPLLELWIHSTRPAKIGPQCRVTSRPMSVASYITRPSSVDMASRLIRHRVNLNMACLLHALCFFAVLFVFGIVEASTSAISFIVWASMRIRN